MAEQLTFDIVWTLECEFKYGDALGVVDRALQNFSFAAYPTEARQLLTTARELLAELMNTAQHYVGTATEAGAGELVEEIQHADSTKAVEISRKNILFQLRSEALRLKITPMAQAARDVFAKIEQLIQAELGRHSSPIQKTQLPSEKEIENRFTDLEVRDILQAVMENLRTIEASTEQFSI